MLFVEDRLQAARDHAAAGRHDNAALLLESILDVSPGHSEALTGLIEARLAIGDIAAARAALDKATPASEQNPGFLTLAAKVSLLSENETGAERLVDRALAVDPFHVQAALLKAEFLARSGALADVEDLLNEVRARSENHDVLHRIASLYFSHGLFGPALAISQQALGLAPEDAHINALVGQVLSALGDHGKAEPFLETAHLKDPANPKFLISIATNSAATGQMSEAMRYAERAKTLYPDLMPAWLCYIKIKSDCGQAVEALKEFAPVAKGAKDRMEATLTLGTAYRLAGEPEKTLQLLEPLLANADHLESPLRAQLTSILKEAYLLTGQLDRLPAILEKPLVASLQISDGEAYDHKDLANGFTSAALIIDPALSNLEFMVMARFLGEPARSRDAPLIGPSARSELAQLFGHRSYIANDIPDAVAPPSDVTIAVPVTQVLALPAVMRGGETGKVPYLPVREDLLERWREALSEFPRPWIGLAWNESPAGLTLDGLLSVLPELSGTRVSAIWDHSRTQLDGHRGIIDAGKHVRHMQDMAALIHALDFVVGPDGIVLHAAGAADTPGIALIPHIAPWYWYSEENRSLWYPSLNVIRAPRAGHWATLLPEMAGELEARIKSRL
ncbi:tetratricopeptide repeat protein [Roseibium sp. MMSF_3544]|uniref:tetratricopeptide repeat protein n=1 Tax=unclassified Roseibium TaxID=2629323 RepID=UPI00273F0703|nr:tetratricopeptide repeat protein [Roseibium sp. MMSF_3544]